MDFPADFFPASLRWAGLVAVALFLLGLLRRFPRDRFSGLPAWNGWLLAVGFVVAIQAMRAEVEPGLNMHLSGATALALMYGWRMGAMGMLLSVVALAALGRVAPGNIGLEFLLHGLLPASFAYGLFLASEAWLPRNFFVYVFGPAFFGAWLTSTVLALVTCLVLVAFGDYSWSLLGDGYLPFYLLLGFSEAFTTGFVLSLLVVYKPELVYTFRDDRYIVGK